MKYLIVALALVLTAYGARALTPRERGYAFCDAEGSAHIGNVDLGRDGWKDGETVLHVDCK